MERIVLEINDDVILNEFIRSMSKSLLCPSDVGLIDSVECPDGSDDLCSECWNYAINKRKIDIRGEIENLLVRHDVARNLKGFVYLADAIEIALSEEQDNHPVKVMWIYKNIADMHNISSQTAEKCIRYALKASHIYSTNGIFIEDAVAELLGIY